MQRKTADKSDPIKKAPLHDPGQSLREQLDDYLNDHIMVWVIVGLTAVAVAGIEWYRWLFNLKISPVLVSVISAIVVLYVVWRVHRARKGLDQIKLGLKGERAIGQFLQNEMLPRRYFVFHDICCDDFNIDHVLIGPGGVFAIETKTRSKAGAGDRRVTYDGTKVLVDGWEPERDPVVQARAAAKRLGEILLDRSGHATNVRPVVLFPGWFVEKQPKGVEVWVLSEEPFVSFIDHEREKLAIEPQRAMAAGLARYVRERDGK